MSKSPIKKVSPYENNSGSVQMIQVQEEASPVRHKRLQKHSAMTSHKNVKTAFNGMQYYKVQPDPMNFLP